MSWTDTAIRGAKAAKKDFKLPDGDGLFLANHSQGKEVVVIQISA